MSREAVHRILWLSLLKDPVVLNLGINEELLISQFLLLQQGLWLFPDGSTPWAWRAGAAPGL